MHLQSIMIKRIIRRLNKEFAKLFFLDQWVIMIAPRTEPETFQWSASRPIVPPPNRYWADPFVVQRDDRYYVFIEEKIYARGRGHIACLNLDVEGNLLSTQAVLERPYHLSYPFLFEHKGELYMLPETAENRTLELYRCARFPDRWEYVQTLMQKIYAVDATLLEHAGKWWLFANIKEGENASSLDRLFLFYADSPLTKAWTPHPQNPVVNGIKSSRPAGRILARTDGLIRPSQDSSRRYGYALNFNRITKLSTTAYEETRIARIAPPRRSKVLAVHTYSEAGELSIVDAVVRRRK
ncbi:MAG: hypothetical protein Kow002_08480 [Anaerolineales bacterium]